ncbi:MAG: TetR/AcrR family transcriptional regulator, partial [Alphaproteobacteria bacterium]
MARQKEFQPDEVVDAAVQVFWDKGYEATSIQDLVDAMGINRGSIYDTFGDKAGLFEAVLERYFETSPIRGLLENADSDTPRAAIEAMFDSLIAGAISPDGRRGCLMTNTLTELCSRDDRLAKKLGSRMLHVENTLTTMIERGQKSGDITTRRDARAVARFLVSTMQGLQAVVKLRPGFG